MCGEHMHHNPIQSIHLAQWMMLRLVLAETRPQAPAGKQDKAGQGCRLTGAQDIGRILYCTTLVFLSIVEIMNGDRTWTPS